MKLDKQIKRVLKEGWQTKRNLWNSTRFDLKIKKQHHWNKLLWSRMRDFHRFMLSWPFSICFWKMIFKHIKISTNFWRWFHSKLMHHLILIIFPKSVLRIASCSVRFAHFLFVIFIIFFSISFFELILFLSFL